MVWIRVAVIVVVVAVAAAVDFFDRDRRVKEAGVEVQRTVEGPEMVVVVVWRTVEGTGQNDSLEEQDKLVKEVVAGDDVLVMVCGEKEVVA